MISNKKHIIFDWNGTLIDDTWIFVDILNALLKPRNIESITIEQYRKKFCFPIKRFYKKLGINCNQQSFLQLEKDFVKEYKARMYLPKLFPNTITTLDMLLTKGVTLSILSASNQKILERLLTHYQIKEYFYKIKGVDNYGANGKPENGLDLLKKINCNKKDVLMIGDTDYDYKIAKILKVDCILMSGGHQTDERLNRISNNVIKSLEKLKDYKL